MLEIIRDASSNLLEHDLRHLRLATTASDNGTMQLEDLVAIADLSAGATVEILTDLESEDKTTSPHVLVPVGPTISRKCRALIVWLAVRRMPHQHVVITIEPGQLKGQVHVRRLKFDAFMPPGAI